MLEPLLFRDLSDIFVPNPKCVPPPGYTPATCFSLRISLQVLSELTHHSWWPLSLPPHPRRSHLWWSPCCENRIFVVVCRTLAPLRPGRFSLASSSTALNRPQARRSRCFPGANSESCRRAASQGLASLSHGKRRVSPRYRQVPSSLFARRKAL